MKRPSGSFLTQIPVETPSGQPHTANHLLAKAYTDFSTRLLELGVSTQSGQRHGPSPEAQHSQGYFAEELAGGLIVVTATGEMAAALPIGVRAARGLMQVTLGVHHAPDILIFEDSRQDALSTAKRSAARINPSGVETVTVAVEDISYTVRPADLANAALYAATQAFVQNPQITHARFNDAGSAVSLAVEQF